MSQQQSWVLEQKLQKLQRPMVLTQISFLEARFTPPLGKNNSSWSHKFGATLSFHLVFSTLPPLLGKIKARSGLDQG